MLQKNIILMQSLKEALAEILWCPNIQGVYKPLEAFIEVPIQVRHWCPSENNGNLDTCMHTF